MLDLFLLCTDLKDTKSDTRRQSDHMIREIYKFLNAPSEKTRMILNGWKEDFQYIYGDVESRQMQMEAFAIQTYFSILMKVIMNETLDGESDAGPEDVLRGKFTLKHGISNYCQEDWYCWPIFELENGFGLVMETMADMVLKYRTESGVQDFVKNNKDDFIKQMYEAVIPKELRHALGEYYTPDWLAEKTLQDTISICEKNVSDMVFLDPTCGSGTFLLKAIVAKRKERCGIENILTSVRGMDINPLAVLTAKTNYLLAIIDLIEPNSKLEIPIYNADIVRLPEEPEEGIGHDFPRDMEKVDAVIGNPPWVNWEYMPERYRLHSQHLWVDYQLFSAGGRDLSFSKEDISILITYIVMDRLLKHHGVIGFVIRQGTFKSAKNGVGFRRFRIRDGCGIRVIKVDDLSRIKAFDNAMNSAALFFARKGEETIYPVPYYLWEKRSDLRKSSFHAYSTLQEVLSQMNIEELKAMPADAEDETSPWISADQDGLEKMKRVLGKNNYRARTGVFTGGANAVYWLRIHQATDRGVVVSNITKRAKRKTRPVTCEVESEYVFPMVKGGTVQRWNASYDAYLLCPHTADTKMWPVPQTDLKETFPLTYQYLVQFQEDLEGRKGFAGWEKEIQRAEFHAILRVGGYTFSKYKVIWKYIASELICAVISDVEDPYLGRKMLMPNEKIMYISTEDEEEAYYLCGVLSSTLVSNCVKSYMNPTSISAHVLNKLRIPDFDRKDERHIAISRACKEGHGKKDIVPYMELIDETVPLLYDRGGEVK